MSTCKRSNIVIRLLFSRQINLGATALASIIGAVTLTSIAASEPFAQLFQLPPELKELAYFQGTWGCEQPADSPSSEPSRFTWTVRPDLNDFWYIGHAEEMVSEANPEPVNSREFLGYDSAAQHLVRLVVVGNGNSLNLTSTGWRDEEFVWEGELVRMGQSMPIREVITRENNNRFSATYFIRNEANDGWQPVVNEVCDRYI